MAETPTNLGRLIAKHQIKFIHGRTITDLEEDINKRLTKAVGKYEVKDITLDLSQTGAMMGVIHYYEQTRLVDSKTPLKQTQTRVGSETTSKKRGVSIEGGTKHIAPSLTTQASHNKKETVQVKPDINSINNELDKLKPGDENKKDEPEEKKKTKLPEGFEVEAASTVESASTPAPEVKVEPTTEPVTEEVKETQTDIDDINKDTRGDLTQEEINNG